MLACRNDVRIVLVPCRVARHVGLTVVEDGVLKTNLITLCLECVLKVAGGLSPCPTCIVTRTYHYRVALAKTVLCVVECLNLEEALVVVVIVDVPYLAEVVHELILRCLTSERAAAAEFLKHLLCLLVVARVEVSLGKEAQGSATCGVTYVLRILLRT